MTEAIKKTKATVEPVPIRENMKQGLLLSLLVAPAGIVLWVILWKFGFIASFVSFAIAWLAVYLYGVGAKVPVSRRAAPYVLGVIVVSVLLAFMSGMASDATDFYIEGTNLSQWDALFIGDYWLYLADNLFNNGALWSSYLVELAIAAGFAVLGCFGVVKALFSPQEPSDTKTKKV